MSMCGKKAAKAFRKKYKLLSPTPGEIKNILAQQGYTVVEFNAIFNDPDVAAIIENLKLDSYISDRKGFTYADSKNRLVFVHEDLSDEEKRSILLHEEGHIFCGHIEENTYLGRDVQQEVEANSFAHCLLYPAFSDRVAHLVQKHRLWIGAAAAVLIVGIVCTVWWTREQQTYGDYVVTDTGNKYHQSECIHVKNRTNVHKLTVEQFESGDYEPCGTCLPQE